VLLSRSAPVEIEHLGQRFIGYARRVRTFEINARPSSRSYRRGGREVERQISSSVVSLWARLGSMTLFPRLQRLMAITPAFGDPWDAQIILDLIDNRPDLTDLRFASRQSGSAFFGHSFRLSTAISGSLNIYSFCHLRNKVAPYGAILNAVLASSPHLRQLEVDQCITIDEMTQLPRLSELTFLFIATPLSPFPLPRLSSGGFPRLRHLKLQETNATLMLMELFLAMHPTTELIELSYQAQWHLGEPPKGHPQFFYVRRFIEHASLWTSLQTIAFNDSVFQNMLDRPSVEESRALFRRLHALRSLRILNFYSNVHLQMSPDIFEHLLSGCPSLEEWTMQTLTTERSKPVIEPISFRELHNLFRDSHVKIQPFPLWCNTLPILDEACHLKPLPPTSLIVCDVGDPAAAAKVLFRIFPKLTSTNTEPWRNHEPADQEDAKRAATISAVLQEMRDGLAMV
jgi:hypothetical protein